MTDDATPGTDPTLTRYEAVSQLRRPRQFVRTGGRSLRAALPLARRLFLRDIRARYRMSVLGFAWIFVPAIAQTFIWLLLDESNIINSGEVDMPLPVFVLVGTLLWQGFVDALMAPGNQLTSAGPTLARVNFPPESLLLAGLADAAVNMMARFLIIIPVFIWFGVVPGWGVLLVPVGVASLLLLGFSVGLAVAPFGLLYQDISRMLVVVTGFWLLITPVAYNIPDIGPARYIVALNPVSPLLRTTRSWMTGGALFPGWSFFAVLVFSLVLLAGAWVVFRLSVPHLVDRIGT